MKLQSIPKYGDQGSDVLAYQTALNAKGFPLGNLDGVFGPLTKTAGSQFQKSVGLTGSGYPGPDTLKALGLEIDDHAADSAPQPQVPADHFNAPWVFANCDLLGLDESNPRVIARFVPEWKFSGAAVANWKDLGEGHPWCMIGFNADMRKVGLPGTNSAWAPDLRKYGREAPDYWFGAGLGIEHNGGGGHATKFLFWIDKSKKLAACYGMNQSNKISVAAYYIGGKPHDTVIGGPRWPLNWPDGRVVEMNSVLGKYPFLKVGGVGGSTR